MKSIENANQTEMKMNQNWINIKAEVAGTNFLPTIQISLAATAETRMNQSINSMQNLLQLQMMAVFFSILFRTFFFFIFYFELLTSTGGPRLSETTSQLSAQEKRW